MVNHYRYTVEAYTSTKRWSISAHDTLSRAIRYAVGRSRKCRGTVKIYNGDDLIWQRG